MAIRVDFHTHSYASKDSLSTPEQIIFACHKQGMDRIVITDHNTIRGALFAHSIAPSLVIVGEEVMTTKGELLAAYVQEEIPAGLQPEKAIFLLREQGAFIGVSHPFDAWRNGGWAINDLDSIVPLVDAIEVFNARCMKSDYNKQAHAYAEMRGLSGTAGSDSHVAFELGKGHVLLPEFSNPEELRNSLKMAEIIGKPSPFYVHLFSKYARFVKKYKV